MNKIYRAIWNESTRTWVAASELAKSKTKANSVSGQTGASLPSLGKSGMNAFKLGLLVSLVHLSLAIPNAYAAGRTGLTGRIEVGSDTGAGNNNLSNNSVILAGDNGDYCGADHVKSRSTIGNAANALTPLEEYLRFAQNWKFTARNKEFNPYGTTEAAENWVAQVTTGHGGYQNGHTGGVTNLLPRAFGINSFALGCAAYVTGNHGLAFGTNATSTAGGAQAFGIAALAGGRASNAIGISSQATGVSGVALGSVATADGNGSVALGLQAKASANSTVAVGVQSQAGVDSAVAIGNNSKASGKQSISIGSDNDISGEGSIAIGSSATATKFKQEDGTLEIVATGKTRISGNHILSLGNSNTGKTSEDAITASDTAIFGNNNTIAANVGVHIIGNNNKIDIVNSNASATIIGNHASVSAGNGLALGNQTIVSGLYAVAIGNGAQATAEGAVALGAGSVADRAGNTAGYNPDSSVTATDPATNTPVWKSTTGAVAVRNANITRRITDVMAGTQDTDAANFGQLKSLSSSLPVSVDSLSTSISESLPKVDPVISSTTNSISTAIDDFNSEINKFSPDVNKKLSEIDTKITAISASISEGITPLRRDALLYENGVYNAGHKDDQAHKIIHVAADENLSADSTYMVNGGQLYTTNSGITSLSVTAKNQLGSLNDSISSSVSANQNLGQVSADLQANKEKVLALQKDVLQWKDGSYSADHGTGKAQIITNVAAGNITPDSTDAINGSQLDSLSTVTQSGLSTAASGLSSLSVSTATGLNSLSSSINSSLSNANEGVTELKQDALQWNGKEYDAGRNGNIQKITNVAAGTVGEHSTDAVNAGQLFSLSNSTSSGLSDLASSLSTIADTHISSLSSGSQSLSTIGDNIVSLSTSFEQTNGSVTALQQNALQWNGQVYDATRDGSTQTLTGITAGRVEADSTDAINGSQLHSLSTVTQSGLSTAASGLSSLSVSTATGLNSLSSSINSSLSNATEGVTELKQDALQWNGKEYNAGRNGNIQKITNVAAGTVGEHSTDAVNAGQLFSLSNSTSSGLSDLASSLSTIADTHISSLSSGSQSLSTIGDNIVSLSTSFEQTNGSVTALQQNALQWNGQVYDATRDGSTQTLTGITAGRVEADSTDAINGSQLDSLSTVTQSGLSTAASGLSSLSVSTATGLNSLSSSINSSLSNANEGVTELKQNALQWNGKEYDAGRNGNIQKITNVAAGTVGEHSTDAVNAGQLFSLSNSTSSGLSDLASSLSTIADTHISSLSSGSQSLSTIGDNIVSLSTSFEQTNGSVTALQQNALQWNGQVYDATRDGSTQTLTGITAGRVEADSTDAINGSQLDSLSTVTQSGLSTAASGLNSLSVSTATGLNSLSSSINSSLSNATEGVTELKQDALQWNGKEYDAGRNGNIQKITNVAAGTIGENSTDAVNAGQLFSLSNSTSSGLSDLASSLSTIADTHISSLSSGSQSLSTIGDNIVSLSTSFEQTNGRVTALQQNALQWNGQVYDATRDGSTQTLTGITAGRVEADSTDAINGSQLDSLSTVTQSGLSTAASGLSSLSVSTATGLNSLSSSINSSLSNANEGVTELKQDALQWNGKEYDAGRNGNIQKITNVAAGTVGENSTDAVNAGQLFSLSNSTSSGLSDLASSLSTIADTHIGSLSSASQSLSTIGDNIDSLSTSFEQTNGSVTALQQNALQWNGQVYDATRDGSTQKLTGIKEGRVEADSTDAINGSQLHSQSTVTQSGLDTAASGLSSLSVSTATGLNSLSSSINSSLSNATEGVTELKQNALQWNNNIGAYDAARNGDAKRITNVAAGILGENSTDAVNAGQLFSLSNSTSSGLSDLASSLSTIADTHIGSLSSASQSLSTIGDNIVSLSTSFEQTNGSVTALQQNALQWNGQVYDATRDGSTQKLTGIKEGRVEADSTDAINGSQLHSQSTVTQSGLDTAASGLSSLSVSTATGLNSLSSSINSSLSNATEGVTELKQNALQWNNNIGAYDAARNGDAKRITNVAAGTVGENSTDAVNAGQLFSLSNSTSSGLSDLASSLSTIADTHISSLSSGSQSLSTIGDNIVSLSTSFEQTNGSVTALQQNALQWNGQVYDATRDGSTQKLTGIKEGRVEADSTDAINGSQLHSQSTVTQSGLDTAASGLSSLSVSTATGLNSLSSSINSSLSNATEGVTELKQNALQWNNNIGAYDAARNGDAKRITNVAAGILGENSTDAVNAGQLFSLSNSTSSGLSDLASSLSTIADTHIGSLSSASQSLSTIGDNIVSLSTSFEQTNGSVTALQQNALQWNGQVYDATRDGSTQKLTGIKEGRVEADSTDAINGSQLHSQSTVTQSGLDTAASGLSSLSVSTATGLNSLSSSINSSLSNATEGVTELKQNALQWNNNIGAYDAARNGDAKRITNVAAGTVGENSTDAVNAGQLFSLSNSTSSGLSDLASSLSTIADTHISSLSSGVSQSLSTIGDNIVSLSTSFEQTNGSVTALQQNALQWNGKVYDATRDGSTQQLTGITAGRVEADSTDAINGSQLDSLSTVTQTGLSTAASGLSSLSVSTATGLNSLSSSLSSSLSNANQSLTELEQNALQWNGKAYDAGRNGNIQKITNVAAGILGENSTDAVNAGQLFSLSNSTSTGLSSLSTAVSDIGSISVSMSTGYNELLNSLSTTQDQLGQLETSTNNKLTSLDTDYQTIHNDVDKLRKENRLQWNNDLGNNGEGGFDASRPNSLTRAPSYGKIVNLADGSLEPDSHEAVNGGQLRIVKDDLLSLSSSASTGLSSISSMVQDTPIAQINNDIGNLQENTLQWNGTAYDATHNGTAQRITNVAAGRVRENSTDAVNNHQLWEVRNDLNSLSTTVNNLPTGGNISQDALNNLSASISTSVANQLRPVAEAIGTNLPPSGIIPAPNYEIYAPNGERTVVHNVRTALENIQNNGASMYAKINSSKQASQAKGEDSIAIGGNAVAQGTSAIAIGDSASAPESNSVALGKEAKVTQDGGVALGAGSVANRAGGRGVGEVYIPPEAKGNDRLVSAIEATRSKEYGAVSVGNTEDGQYRQITGVAAGTEDTDAVNVAQLKGVSNQISKVNEYVNQLNDNLHHVERRAYSGTAMAMALSGAYLPSLSSGGQAVGIGVGTYRSYGAIGVNYKAASKNGKITWGAGVSTTGKEAAVNSAIGFKW